MLPRWFRALLAAQVAGAVAVVIVAAHVLLGGAPAAGRVIDWARSSPASPPPSLVLPSSVGAAATPAPGSLVPAAMRRLSGDTAATAVGQYALVRRLELLIEQQITRAIARSETGDSGG